MVRTPNGARDTGADTTPDQGQRGLDPAQLSALEQAFRAWVAASRRHADRLSRQRLLLIFLLLRSTGARLGEVLGLDAGRDLDLEPARPLARFRSGPHSAPHSAGGDREVPLPSDVARELRAALADEELMGSLASGPAGLFDMDQGHVRRKFYERALEAGIPRELASPSVLRRSLARSLVRQDVPLPVVQRLLGQSSASLTAAFCDYSEDEAGRIVEDYLKREERRKSSARNRFAGQITGVTAGPVVSSVELTSLGGFKVVSVVTTDSVERLGIRPGVLATADIKAPWVQLSAGAEEPLSTAANRYPAVVRRILAHADEPVAAEVVAELSDGTRLAAVVTAESAKRLGLKAGAPVWVSFGAFSVILNFG
ncbi:MAG: TOBE domain-containing protein [Humidesulfovibrio sp.]|uniref:TOBE domain-containing protein n=1 Tax=Humidesulfovibrio sp. TaxID=2910988 RepID=UPI0027F6B780|nr:TOBE domain-containing protein [Humidesulfovibrio sp.]MDQ7836191.1 TOBE domain-containing protein [Humidesulfovibrio sp.]